ncbi:MAG: c-type cytochrome [Planctomycetes bacterium]|nr:c-type cytochrome [Planctomycetota bacterium]
MTLALLLGADCATAQADTTQSPVERGKTALLTRDYNPATWRPNAYDDAWKHWGDLKEKPKDYARAFMDRYGLHPAPYDNGRFPMGVREGTTFLGKGMTVDCMICHGGSINGKSYVGLGNSTFDIQAFYEEMGRASGGKGKTPFVFGNVRGTSEAGAMAVFLLSYRQPDLSIRLNRLDLGLRDDMCEDVPAWWLLKKKKTMYHTGGSDARSVRSLMQFMLSPLNLRETFVKEEATFADIQAYLLSLEAPKYPFPIDRELASAGTSLFESTCARCHGTYGDKWTYPNKIVPLDVIGTDRRRFDGISRAFGEHYNKSWFGEEKRGNQPLKAMTSDGYQAPPLDGVWATAPYFHNGSAPTVHDVLNSKNRPKIFTRSYRTDAEDYDQIKLGWKVRVLDKGADASMSPYESRKIYDTTLPGRGNAGHTFGDHFTDAERRAVIEYLKTL